MTAATATYTLSVIAVASRKTTVIGVGLLGYWLYELYDGGAEAIYDSAGRLLSGEGTFADAQTMGRIVGGIAGGKLGARGARGASAGSRGNVRQRTPSSPEVAPRAVAHSCFVVGAEVWTDEGLIPIETVVAGQSVACAEAESAEWSYCEVEERLSHHYDGVLVSIMADGQSVEATSNHPFWVASGDELEFRPLATDAGADAIGGGRSGPMG